MEQNENNKAERVLVSESMFEAVSMIQKLHDFFDTEDPHGIYLQDSEDLFGQLTDAAQRMLGCEVYWRIGDQAKE